ncbi:Zinc finger BED domain-containing protein 4 [Eumeta japonica]|uniref:Zinc finger BED domain-containing protein 4 n=1 Tax=Eumeta variegata TaxID=151549 RepID=A0A4C2A2V2_EUMVA|nr:Zinc finger BED domain-containing protein 4 [Eumeta japonica]
MDSSDCMEEYTLKMPGVTIEGWRGRAGLHNAIAARRSGIHRRIATGRSDAYAAGRTTLSLKNHLKSMHPHELTLFEKANKEKELQKMKTDAGKSITPLQEAKKQLSLEEVIQKANKWDVNNVNSKKIDKLIGEMIPLQNLPFNFVEGLGFRRLIQEIAPRYNFRGRNFFTEFVYPSSNASLLTSQCHGIASDFERSSIILKCETFDDRHTGDIIAEKFDTMLSEWNISNDQVHCMIRDGCSNMKRAMRLVKLQDLDCAVHKMQLAIQSSLNSQENIKGIKQKCKKISTHFNHSTIAQKQLHKIQDKLNQPHLKVFQDCVTRWNSTYYMLERFLKAKDALNLYINDSEIDPILPEEWKIIECCVELLKPFEEATRELSSSHTHLISDSDNWMLTQNTERAKKMRMTDSMDTDSERPGTSGTGRQSCLISDLAMILDSSSDDESQKTPEINNPDIRIRIRIRGCEPLKSIRPHPGGCEVDPQHP